MFNRRWALRALGLADIVKAQTQNVPANVSTTNTSLGQTGTFEARAVTVPQPSPLLATRPSRNGHERTPMDSSRTWRTPSRSDRVNDEEVHPPSDYYSSSASRHRSGRYVDRDVSPTARLAKVRRTSRDQTAVSADSHPLHSAMADTRLSCPDLTRFHRPGITDSRTTFTSATTSFASTLTDRSNAAAVSFGTELTEPDDDVHMQNGCEPGQNPVEQHLSLTYQHGNRKENLTDCGPLPLKPRTIQPEYWKIRDLPKNGLFRLDSPPGLSFHHICVRYECARVALANGFEISEVAPPADLQWQNLEILWEYFRTHHLVSELPPKCPQEAWNAALTDFNRVDMKGRLSLQSKDSEPIFRLHLHPLELSSTSRRLARAFGHDRFLQLELPSLTFPKGDRFKGQAAYLEARFQQCLSEELKFLGRTWRAFHLRDVKKEKGVRREQNEYIRQVVFFATEGCDIKPRDYTGFTERQSGYSSRPAITVAQLLDWHMPFQKLSEMPYLKAFSRLDLGRFLLFIFNHCS